MKNIVLLFSFCILICICSCGYKTLPSPSNNSELFSFHNVNGNIINNTLAISGQILGNAENLSSIRVEIQAITEDCIACPFVSEFSEEFYAKTILDYKNNVFMINYTLFNNNITEYRWRIVAKNYIFGIEEIYSPIYITKK